MPETSKETFTPKAEEILFLKADKNYTIFHFQNGRKSISSYTLKKHQKELQPHGFVRVNRSFLVNLRFVSACKEGQKAPSIRLINNHIELFSRRRIEAFDEVKNYLDNKSN